MSNNVEIAPAMENGDLQSDYDYEYDDDEDDDDTWIRWFCSLKGNEFFCVVPDEFVFDNFNLTGLKDIVPHYNKALDIILDSESESYSDKVQYKLDTAAEMLYGLIHARYILSPAGMAAMREKYLNADFGFCSRPLCAVEAVVPIGKFDFPCRSTVLVYCPRCNDIYYPKSSRHLHIDGAYFGTSFAHIFFMTYPPKQRLAPVMYTPKIYGFNIRRKLPNDENYPDLDEKEEVDPKKRARQRMQTIVTNRRFFGPHGPPLLPLQEKQEFYDHIAELKRLYYEKLDSSHPIEGNIRKDEKPLYRRKDLIVPLEKTSNGELVISNGRHVRSNSYEFLDEEELERKAEGRSPIRFRDKTPADGQHGEDMFNMYLELRHFRIPDGNEIDDGNL